MPIALSFMAMFLASHGNAQIEPMSRITVSTEERDRELQGLGLLQDANAYYVNRERNTEVAIAKY